MWLRASGWRLEGWKTRKCGSGCLLLSAQPGCEHWWLILEAIMRNFWIASPCPYGRFLTSHTSPGNTILLWWTGLSWHFQEIITSCQRYSASQALLGLLFVNMRLMEGVILGVCLGHRDHEMVEFNGWAFSAVRKKDTDIATLDFSGKKPSSYSWSSLAEYPGNLLRGDPWVLVKV